MFTMKRKAPLFLLAIFILAGVFSFAQAANDPAPKISVDQRHIDFGYIPFDFNFVHFYTIKNEGSADLKLNKLIPNCDCTYVIPSDTVIKPGMESDLKVVFGTEQYYGPNTRHIEVHSNDPNSPLIYLEYASNIGTYPRQFRVSPHSLFFLPGQNKLKISLANLGGNEVEYEIALEKDSLFTLSEYKGKIGKTPLELFVYPNDDLGKGNHETNFTVIYKTKPVQRITIPIKIVR